MNNSIEFVKEYLISNKEEILREVHDRNYVHHCRNFKDLKVEIQSEDRIPTEILSPIVKEMLGFNNISTFSTRHGIERTDLMGYSTRTFSDKSISIIRLK